MNDKITKSAAISFRPDEQGADDLKFIQDNDPTIKLIGKNQTMAIIVAIKEKASRLRAKLQVAN